MFSEQDVVRSQNFRGRKRWTPEFAVFEVELRVTQRSKE